MSRVIYTLVFLFLALPCAVVHAEGKDFVQVVFSKGVKGPKLMEGVTEGGLKVNNVAFNVSRNIASSIGRATNREASAPQISEITLELDNASSNTDLFKLSLTGEGQQVKIEFYRAAADAKSAKDQLELYQTITLENTLVSKYEFSKNDTDPIRILIGMNFTKILIEAGKAKASFDAATGKGS